MSGYFQQQAVVTNADQVKEVFVICPGGRTVLGGGFEVSGPVTPIVRANGPTGPGFTNAWTVRIENGAVSGGDWTVTATAVCVNIP